jgi:hypothetical protein
VFGALRIRSDKSFVPSRLLVVRCIILQLVLSHLSDGLDGFAKVIISIGALYCDRSRSEPVASLCLYQMFRLILDRYSYVPRGSFSSQQGRLFGSLITPLCN